MTHPRRKPIRTLIPASLLLALAGVLGATIDASAQTAAPFAHPAPPTSTLRVEPDSWTIVAGKSYDMLQITLEDPTGAVIVGETDASDRLTLDAYDDNGGLWADGTYRYEVRGREAEQDVLIASGSFTVADGAFVDPAGPENTVVAREADSADQAQTISEDLLVDGSTCIGDECDGYWRWGYNTLVLREDNTRILFEDTSSIQSFPKRNWALIANDHLDGGAERFSIDDCGPNDNCNDYSNVAAPFTLLGGAPDNSLFIDSAGEVGLGTSIPDANLHIVSDSTPTLRLQSNASSASAPQVWELSGGVSSLSFLDVLADTEPMLIGSGAPDESLVVASDGNVGLGTSQPVSRLDVLGDISLSGVVDGRDVAADGTALDQHLQDRANPHRVTAGQVGADPVGRAAQIMNQHMQQVPHVATLPVPVNQGGTGATNPAEARIRLGLAEHQPKAGLIIGSAFQGYPPRARVVFRTPFSGVLYAITLTVEAKDWRKDITVMPKSRTQQYFDLFTNDNPADIQHVYWTATPVTEPILR